MRAIWVSLRCAAVLVLYRPTIRQFLRLRYLDSQYRLRPMGFVVIPTLQAIFIPPMN